MTLFFALVGGALGGLVASYVGKLESKDLHDDEAHFEEVPHEYKPLKLVAEAVNNYFKGSDSFKEDRAAARKELGLDKKKKKTKTPNDYEFDTNRNLVNSGS